MTAVEDQLDVLRLACCVQDRSPAEQRALLRLAIHVERQLNASTSRNMKRRWLQPPCRIVDEVEATHVPSRGAAITLTAADRARVDRRRASWVRETQAAIDHHGPGWSPS